MKSSTDYTKLLSEAMTTNDDTEMGNKSSGKPCVQDIMKITFFVENTMFSLGSASLMR
jgi:hypothetical protein